MSTWNKASKVNQNTHRERQQLRNRSHLGFLEKKKDYKARANYENQKKQIFKSLKKRALNRNPDEFYFHMVNSKVIDDVHKDKIKELKHTPEQISLMHTRDLKYITMKRTIEKNKIEKLQSRLHYLDKTNNIKNSHLFFLDTDEEAKNFDLAKHLQTHPSLLNRRYNRPRIDDLTEFKIPEIDDETVRKMNLKNNKMYRELEKRIKREKELAIVQRKSEIKKYLKQSVDLQPKIIKKASPKSAPVYKWRQERKK